MALVARATSDLNGDYASLFYGLLDHCSLDTASEQEFQAREKIVSCNENSTTDAAVITPFSATTYPFRYSSFHNSLTDTQCGEGAGYTLTDSSHARAEQIMPTVPR
jgi:hypothetical protein